MVDRIGLGVGAVSALVVTLAVPVHAQDGPDVAEVVVTAAPFPLSLDTATTHVEILKAEDIAKLPPGGLGEALASVAGVRSSAYAPGASRPVIRGQSGQRVQVLQNGLGLVDASALSPDHAVASDPAEASRIEVLRGPSALAYGGSAVGGVVNVIDDRIPRRAPENGHEGRIAASAGGAGQARGAAGSVVLGRGPLVFAFDGNVHASEAYDVPVAPVSRARALRDGLTVDPKGVVENSFVDFEGFGAGLALIGEPGSAGLSFKHTATRYGVPYPQILAPIDPNAEGPVGIDLVQDRIDLRAQRQVALGPFELVRFAAGWADYEHAEFSALTGDIGTRFLSDGVEGRLELIQAPRFGWQGAIGAQGLTRDLAALGDEAFIPASSISEAAAFAIQRYEQGRLGFDAGLRLDRRTISADLAGRAASDPAAAAGIDWALADPKRSFTNVSASLGAFFRPGDHTFLSLSVSRNARAPTESELYADGPHPGAGGFELGDPTLRPETAYSAEALARWASGRLSLEGHLFAARYEAFIDQRPTGAFEDGLPVFAFVQTDAEFRGGEVEARLKLVERPQGALSLETAIDWVRGASDLGPVARIPPHRITARLDWEGRIFDARLDVQHAGDQDRLADFETPTDAYTLVNLYAAWKPSATTRLFIDGRNLGDAEVREHVSFLKDVAPAPGRSLRIGLSSTF